MWKKKFEATRVGFLSKKAKKIIVPPRTNALLPVLCIRVKTGCFVNLRYSRGYSSVVEQSAAVRGVPGSNPCVPWIKFQENVPKRSSGQLENRSWLPSSIFVCVQGLSVLEFDNHRQYSWVVRFLSSACEVPASNKSLRGKKNLRRLSRHSEQGSEKHHSKIKEEHFLIIYVWTSKNRVLCRVMNHKETWHSGKEFVCTERGTCREPVCPKSCTKGIVRKCPPGHLLEKNKKLTWWPKKGVGSHQVVIGLQRLSGRTKK